MPGKLGIIIPVYNEGANIGPTLEAIKASVAASHTVYIVYDFPEDNTLPVARGYSERGHEIEFLLNPERGAVGAIKTGLRQAPDEYLLVTMADMSDDYADVDAMVSAMDAGADVVCGSRYMKGGRQLGGPPIKKAISRMAGVSLHWLAGVPTHDATNSFKLYRRSFIESVTIESDGGFEVGLELVVKAHLAGRRVAEVPTTWRDREAGQSRFKILKWAPKYLRWYMLALRGRLFGAG